MQYRDFHPSQTIELLLVEDSLADARLLQAALADEASSRVELTHLERLADALELLGRRSFDAGLLDLALPDAQGLEIVRRVREVAPQMPLVVLTGRDDEALAAAALQEGAQDYLPKGSLDAPSLLRAMRHAIERQRLVLERTELLRRETRARTHAEEAVAARDRILGIVAHDLRNPLNTVSLSLALLADPGLPEPVRSHQLEVARRSIRRMDGLIQDLLDVARIEAGHLSVATARLEAAALVTEAVELHREQAREKRVQLELECAAPLPGIEADHARILQVFSNLIGNALKFTPQGGRILVCARDAKDEVHFCVEDTGPGVPHEDVPRLFESYWQGRSGTRTGAGLGLAITRGILEAHGGRIWVESRPGSGSTFFFALPVPGGSQTMQPG